MVRHFLIFRNELDKLHPVTFDITKSFGELELLIFETSDYRFIGRPWLGSQVVSSTSFRELVFRTDSERVLTSLRRYSAPTLILDKAIVPKKS